MSESVTFKWHIDDAKLKKLIHDFPEKVDAFGRSVAAEMVGDIKMGMTLSPADTSKAYHRGQGRIHNPSFPKNPPRVDMGTLRASIRWKPARGEITRRLLGNNYAYIIHDGVEYGVHLEYGTTRMEARPWMTPVFMDWLNNKFTKAARKWDWK